MTSYLWGKVLLWSAGVKLEIKGSPPARGTSYVYVANHLSMLDIAVVLVADRRRRVLCFGSDPQWFEKKFLGWAMRRGQHFPVDRDNPMAGYRELLRAVEERGDGIRSAVIYPEGTRSRSGKLNSFKKGAFRASVKHKRSIVPLFIDGTWDSLPPQRPLLLPRPAKVVVYIGEPIETVGGDAEKIENDVRDWMMSIANAPA